MIYYFSGTGNSYAVAKKLAEALGEELTDIAEAVKAGNYKHTMLQGERLGFVFPVYAWAPPQTVTDFVKNLELYYSGDPYLFAVCTCGSSAGEAIDLLGKALQENGLTLDSGFSVVMPDSFNPYNALVLQGVEEKAKELGYNVIIGNTNCDRALERDLLKSFVSMKVSGILAIPSWLENYKTIPLPLIIMSRFPYMEPYASKAHAILRPDVQYIVNDDFSGQYLAVEHLIQRGFRNNYLIIGSTEPDSAEGVMNLMRKDGYRKALADAGIAFAEDHVIENVRSIHESYRVVTQLLKSGAGRIGLCMNMDHLALAAISAAHDCGARIPEDIGLVGYDDIHIRRL